jgi:hypothetical protein
MRALLIRGARGDTRRRPSSARRRSSGPHRRTTPTRWRCSVEAGADINQASAKTTFAQARAGQSVLPKGGWTPLMYAAREDAQEAVRMLADKGRT